MSRDPHPLSAKGLQRLQSQLLDSMQQAILTFDLSGRIVYWNLFAEEIYGWSAEEVYGRTIDDVFASSTLMESVTSNMEQLRNGESWLGRISLQRRNGESVLTHISASLMEDAKRTVINIMRISRGSSEHQQLQDANRLLAEVSAQLIDTDDIKTPLTTLASLAIPQLADWCMVHLLQSDGSVEQVALAPNDVAKIQAAEEWLQKYLPQDDTDGLLAVLQSGQPKLVNNVTKNPWAKAAGIKSYMIVPIISYPKTLGAVTFIALESGRRFGLNSLAVAEDLVSHISTYLDKARLYRESQRLNTELEQRVIDRTAELRSIVEQLKQSEAMIQTLFRISDKLNATLNLDKILNELLQEAIRIVEGEEGYAGLRTDEGMTVQKFFKKNKSIPFEHLWLNGEGVPGWVMKNRIPYVTNDAANDPLIDHNLPFNLDIHNEICTPIIDSTGEVLGYFTIRNKPQDVGFIIEDQETLKALASSASIAIQNALAYQKGLQTVSELKKAALELQDLAASIEFAREEERKKISRELHDQLGQALTAMKFDIMLGVKDTKLSKKTKALTSQMDAMIKMVRRISTELRPGMLDDLGLAATVEWQAQDFEERTKIKCLCRLDEEDTMLPRDESLAIFRIFQEVLTNVARHANAKSVLVTLTHDPEKITLVVHDDGSGIKRQEIAGLNSLGLLGMRERANRLGGTFEIKESPEGGTVVTVSIPIQLAAKANEKAKKHA